MAWAINPDITLVSEAMETHDNACVFQSAFTGSIFALFLPVIVYGNSIVLRR